MSIDIRARAVGAGETAPSPAAAPILPIQVRCYRSDDEPALLAIERASPRGDVAARVTFRRRFLDHAALYDEPLVLVADEGGRAVAVACAAIKWVRLAGQQRRVAYLFDLRVAPTHRRLGLARALLGTLEHATRERGCVGAYSVIMSTNRPGVSLLEGLGYTRRRQLRRLEFTPLPAQPPLTRARRSARPRACVMEESTELYCDRVEARLAPHGFERWTSRERDATISIYERGDLFFPLEAGRPWPTPDDAPRHWQLFHAGGQTHGLERLLAMLRDRAVGERVATLSMMIDSEQPLPGAFFAGSAHQRSYLLLTRPFDRTWDGTLGPRLYCDPRDI